MKYRVFSAVALVVILLICYYVFEGGHSQKTSAPASDDQGIRLQP
jgi:hypothetical protein